MLTFTEKILSSLLTNCWHTLSDKVFRVWQCNLPIIIISIWKTVLGSGPGPVEMFPFWLSKYYKYLSSISLSCLLNKPNLSRLPFLFLASFSFLASFLHLLILSVLLTAFLRSYSLFFVLLPLYSDNGKDVA